MGGTQQSAFGGHGSALGSCGPFRHNPAGVWPAGKSAEGLGLASGDRTGGGDRAMLSDFATCIVEEFFI